MHRGGDRTNGPRKVDEYPEKLVIAGELLQAGRYYDAAVANFADDEDIQELVTLLNNVGQNITIDILHRFSARVVRQVLEYFKPIYREMIKALDTCSIEEASQRLAEAMRTLADSDQFSSDSYYLGSRGQEVKTALLITTNFNFAGYLMARFGDKLLAIEIINTFPDDSFIENGDRLIYNQVADELGQILGRMRELMKQDQTDQWTDRDKTLYAFLLEIEAAGHINNLGGGYTGTRVAGGAATHSAPTWPNGEA